VSSMAQRVDPPHLQPPAVSLVRSANTPTDDTNGRWALQGIRYLPEANATVVVDDSCGASAGTYTHEDPDEVEWNPYVVLAYDECSLLSSFARDYIGRATRLLDAALPKAVEVEFESGTLAQAKSWPNLYLRKAGVTNLTPASGGAAVSIGRAFALLEQALADCGFGGQGVIHCTRGVLPDLVSTGLRRDGNLIRTLYDTLVVPGVGYSGAAPLDATGTQDLAAGEVYLYATGPVDFRQTTVTPFPDWPQGANGSVPAAAINKNLNTVRLWAARTALASWDGQCHFAVQATIPA
jgi:hypothetical protein